MFLSTFLLGCLLAGHAVAFPPVFDKENSCSHDELLQCFLSSFDDALSYCYAFASSAVAVETPTATSSAIQTTTVATTGTNVITETILATTYLDPVLLALLNQPVVKRRGLPPPDCLEVSYLASEVVSACYCIGAPILAVSATHAATTNTNIIEASEKHVTTTADATVLTSDTTTVPLPETLTAIVSSATPTDTLSQTVVADAPSQGTPLNVVEQERNDERINGDRPELR